MPNELPRISEEQKRAFAEANPELLLDKVVRYIRAEHSRTVAGISDPVLSVMVWNAFERARRAGLSDPADLAGFALVSFAVAPNFDEQRDIGRAIQLALKEPGPVLERALEAVPPEAFQDAVVRNDERAWYSEVESG